MAVQTLAAADTLLDALREVRHSLKQAIAYARLCLNVTLLAAYAAAAISDAHNARSRPETTDVLVTEDENHRVL